ncbi:MAG: glutamine-synthetase adenylyltransferase [Alphaproteobacteria bacterium]
MGAERWREAADKALDSGLGRAARALLDSARWQPLLTGVFGSSPFLTESLIGNLDTVLDYAQSGPDAALARTLAALEGDTGPEAEPAPVERALRLAKRRVALVTALADLTADWPLETVTRTLSEFAGRAADIAAQLHARRLARAGAIALAGPGLDGSGIIILGMGKLGAFELNYSSDVDLIVFYDPEKLAAPEPDRLRQHMVRFTQNAMQSLSNRTADGYVFRTDLRLRPDPASTPAAVSVLAAEVYYETMGQNWERAAMIKARPVAADRAAGDAFLARLRPFVWRRSLDFNAIQDIHSIKRQINAHRGGNAIAVLGHNVKLGRGGIREIEFFAQTQQLIFGGREPALRQRGTCDALRALAAAGRTPQAVCDELIDSYRFLRTVEHRLQMVDDQQTHTLPETDAELHAFARFCGYEGAEPFTRDLLFHLRRVEDHYGHLFEEAPSLAAPGNLVFTGVENDPDTLATIAKLGYRDPETVSTLIRGWHHGRHRAMRSARAREVLTELVPAIIAALAKSVNPDDAFRRFDTFIAQLPAGAQFFALLHANPGLLALLADIMGSAPRLPSGSRACSILFDTVLSPDFHKPAAAARGAGRGAGGRGGGRRRLRRQARRRSALGAGPPVPDRRAVPARRRRRRGRRNCAVRHRRRGDRAPAAWRPRLSSRASTDAFRARRSRCSRSASSAAASFRRLPISTSSSCTRRTRASSSPTAPSRSRSATTTRASRRACSTLAAPTAEGNLYHVDLRLRPAGNKGPLASSFQAFLQYQQRDAWTWEHMALTRARFVAGDAAFGAKVMDFARGILTQPRDAERLLADVADMRRRVAEQHAARSPWEVKHVRGGLVDVEFIAQYLLLRHAHAHPGILASSIAEAYGRLGAAGLVPAERAASLAAAARLLQQVQAMLRLTIVEEGFDEAAATGGPQGGPCPRRLAPPISTR